ncbi:MAG: hypothetical protein ACLUUO_05815 [Sellimonas intestinalis]
MIGKREMQKITSDREIDKQTKTRPLEADKSKNMPTSGYQMLRESLDIAIKAPRRNPAVPGYRNRGRSRTECQRLKRQIEHSEHLAEVLKSTKSLLEKRGRLLSDYCKIGTVEECREAVEKQKPKKIIRIVGRYPYKCPTCNGKLEIGYRHCIICGQLLRYPYENLEEMEDE